MSKGARLAVSVVGPWLLVGCSVEGGLNIGTETTETPLRGADAVLISERYNDRGRVEIRTGPPDAGTILVATYREARALHAAPLGSDGIEVCADGRPVRRENRVTLPNGRSLAVTYGCTQPNPAERARADHEQAIRDAEQAAREAERAAEAAIEAAERAADEAERAAARVEDAVSSTTTRSSGVSVRFSSD